MDKLDFSDVVDDRMTGRTPLECARKVELRILRIFDSICKEHGLQYCLAYGTLLGAIRHGGFIPWDDDIDVHMPIEDYRKFIEVSKDALPDDIRFYHGAETQCGFGKLIDSKSIYIDETSVAQYGSEPMGIFVDIFPVRRYLAGGLHMYTTRFVRHAKLHSMEYGDVTLVNLVKKWFWRAILNVVLYPLDFLNSRGCGQYAGIPQRMWGSSYAMLPEWPFPSILVRFEGFKFPAPKDSDRYLRAMYGDYMQLPPPEKRFCHAKNIVPWFNSVNEEF